MKTACLVLLGAATIGFGATADGARWWSYVQFLASDDLQGRNTGSEGHRKAADFVAAQFERAGLQPSGTQGYIQPVPFDTLQLNEEQSALVLKRGKRERMLTLGEDAIIGTRSAPVPEVEAELVFVGYGLRVPEYKHDDFTGLNVKGKIAVYVTGAPSSIPGALAAHYQSSTERRKVLKSVGIIGAISIPNPRHMDIPWERIAANRDQVTMRLATPENETGGLQITATWNPVHADELLADTGHTLDEIIDAVESRKQVPRFPIKARLKATTSVKRNRIDSQNIVAIYPGSDPLLKDQYVVMSAHIDHLGVGAAVNGDAIFNGAMDNAAGVATVLDIAAYLKETDAKLRRSVLFVVVTGEEKGDLGSTYFAAHPTVPAASMIANINSDMFLPLYPLKQVIVEGLEESTLGDEISKVAADMGIEAIPDPEPQRNSFIRSDQYSFVLKGIPALAMRDGYVKGSREEKIFKAWLTERYHAVSDDLNQPVDKQAAGTFNLLVANLLQRVANAETKPSWKAESFFRRYASN